MLFNKLILKLFSELNQIMHVTFLKSCQQCCCVLRFFEILSNFLPHSAHFDSCFGSIAWNLMRSCLRRGGFWSWGLRSSRSFWNLRNNGSFWGCLSWLSSLSSLLCWRSNLWGLCCFRSSCIRYPIWLNDVKVSIYLNCFSLRSEILFNNSSSRRSNINIDLIRFDNSNYFICLNKFSWFLQKFLHGSFRNWVAHLRNFDGMFCKFSKSLKHWNLSIQHDLSSKIFLNELHN